MGEEALRTILIGRIKWYVQRKCHTRGGTQSWRPSGGVLGITMAKSFKTVWLFLGWLVTALPQLASGQELKERTTLQGHTDWVLSVAISSNGRLVASGSRDNTVRLWEVATGKERAVLRGHSESVNTVAFSPDGQTLASGSGTFDKVRGWLGGEIKLWDVARSSERATLRGHSRAVGSLDFSPDGKTLASGADDDLIKLWDVSSGRVEASFRGHAELSGQAGRNSVWCAKFSPDGTVLAVGGTNQMLKLWDVKTGREKLAFHKPTGHITSICFSPDGKTLASGSFDATIKLWEVASGKERAAIKKLDYSVGSVAFSPDGKTLVSGDSGDPPIRLWDVSSGQEKATRRGKGSRVEALAFSTDGKILVSAGLDKKITLWDIPSRDGKVK
jgi:WD40 repeat protein